MDVACGPGHVCKTLIGRESIPPVMTVSLTLLHNQLQQILLIFSFLYDGCNLSRMFMEQMKLTGAPILQACVVSFKLQGLGICLFNVNPQGVYPGGGRGGGVTPTDQ